MTFSCITCFVAVLAFFMLSLLYWLLGHNRPFKACSESIFGTFVFWSLLNLMTAFVGFKIPVSLLSLAVSVFLGIPGIISLVVARLIV